MSYRVSILPKAMKGLESLPAKDQSRIRNRIDELAEQPRPVGSTKLAGYANWYRIRVGDYRVVYTIDDTGRVVVVLIIAHRRESYRGL